MKKVFAILLCFATLTTIVVCFQGCGSDFGKKEITLENIKVGFIFIHGEESSYDKNFMDAAKEVQKKLGLSDNQVIFRDNIDEAEICYDTAVELAKDGCNIIFANSFGHEDYMIRAAKKFGNVEFCHATGTRAHTEKLANYHNAFASIYEGRYLAGIAAGLKLNEMIADKKITPNQAVMGYVAAYQYAEVISGYTSFYLGAKSVCPSVTMKVVNTNTWLDLTKEMEGALRLINEDCVLISQHADSMGAPSICEERGIPNISYNGGLGLRYKNTHILSSKINWVPYFEYMINCVVQKQAIASDWVGTIQTGSVVLTEINEKAAAEGTNEAIDEAIEQLLLGEINVFDTDNFTVDGEILDEYMADVNTDSSYKPDTQVIKDGVFLESYYRSAPYFNIAIDGITIIGDIEDND